MAKPDLFDEIIECLKMQAILTPHTDVGEEILREFFTDAVKPVSVRQPSVAPGMQQRASAPPVSKPFQAPPRQPSVPPVPSVRSVLPGQHSVLGDPSKMRWDEIAAAVASCQGCKLCRTRTNTVFGDGDPHAKLMFLGEAPGADEDLQGLPFVGRAGELLTRMINAISFNRAQVYRQHRKCRSPTRNPERMKPLPAVRSSCGKMSDPAEVMSCSEPFRCVFCLRKSPEASPGCAGTG